MRVRTVLLAGSALLLLAAGGTLWWLYASREALIKHAIERYGPDLTGVSVKVKSVKLEPVEGLGAIGGVWSGNPPRVIWRRSLALCPTGPRGGPPTPSSGAV